MSHASTGCDCAPTRPAMIGREALSRPAGAGLTGAILVSWPLGRHDAAEATPTGGDFNLDGDRIGPLPTSILLPVRARAGRTGSRSLSERPCRDRRTDLA